MIGPSASAGLAMAGLVVGDCPRTKGLDCPQPTSAVAASRTVNPQLALILMKLPLRTVRPKERRTATRLFRSLAVSYRRFHRQNTNIPHLNYNPPAGNNYRFLQNLPNRINLPTVVGDPGGNLRENPPQLNAMRPSRECGSVCRSVITLF